MEVAAQLQLAARPVRLELHALARLNCPAILHWDMNHFVVLVELRKAGAVIHAPARGRCRMTHAELSRHFTGVALEITPTHEFAPRVERRRISLRALLGRPRGARRTITEVLLLALVLEVFGIVSPWFMQLVVDHALVSEDRNLIVVLATGFLMLALIQVAVTALRGWVLMVFSTQTHLQLVSNLFRHLLRLPMVYFEKRHLGDVVSRFESLNAIQRTLTGSFIEAVVDGLMVIATLVMMYIYSPLLALVVCGAAVLYGAVRALWYRPLREAEEEQILRTAKQQSHFLESVRGVQSLKLFNRAGERRAVYQNLAADHLNAGIRVQRLHIVFKAVNGVLFGAENVAVIGGEVLVDGAAFARAVEELQTLQTAHALEEMRLLLGSAQDLFLFRLAQWAIPQCAHRAVQHRRAAHHQRQQRTIDVHHHQGRDHHETVHHCLDEAAGERALYRIQRFEARHHVAEVALLEIDHGQTQQVTKEIADELQVGLRAEHHQHPAAQRRHRDLYQREHQKTRREHDDEIAILRDQRVVHHELHEPRTHDTEDLEHQGEQQDLGDRAPHPARPAEQCAQRDAAPLAARRELVCGRALHRHAREVTRELRVRQAAAPARRIVAHCARFAQIDEHHEVLHVPMQDRGADPPRERSDLEPPRPRREMQLPGALHQLREARAFRGDRVAAAQRREIDCMAVKACDHRDTGKAALRRLGLQDLRRARAAAEVQCRKHRHVTPSPSRCTRGRRPIR